MDRDEVIGHLQIIHTWASFALQHDLNFFNEKHLKSIVDWTDDALKLLKEQEQSVDELQKAVTDLHDQIIRLEN